MRTVTKEEIVKQVAERSGLSARQTSGVVQNLLDSLQATLANGDRVELRNFGIFVPVCRKARLGRDPRGTGPAQITIPEKTIVKFKPGRELANAVNRAP